ncbi:MAG: DNA/RNA non-specific endonuclease [Candidatus Latescibacterota bacterium]
MNRNMLFIYAAFSIIFFCGSAFCEFKSVEEALPAHTDDRNIVRHTGYTLQYDDQYEQADWAVYILTAEHLKGTIPRTGNFRADPAVKTGSAVLDDYRKSGYDRGHMAPAADMKWSKKAMSESFYLSNMSPQKHEFNAGIWETLESKVREWGKENGEIAVVTGPVLKSDLPRIGNNRVAVPGYFYKVILDYKMPEYKAIAFVIPNQAVSSPLQAYVVAVDSVEHLTGIDFFPSLPDSLENVLESSVQPALWHLPGAVLAAANQTTAGLNTQAAQDSEKTKATGNIKPIYSLLIIMFFLIAVAVALWLFLKMMKEMLRQFKK